MLDCENQCGREQEIIELTHFMMHKHYCENDIEAVLAQLDEGIIWLGAGENECAVGIKDVTDVFRQFAGKIPKCNIWDEQYYVLELGPEVYLCSGRMWIATDASTQISLRVHQRVTMIFCWKNEKFLCNHIHISNPYEEMLEGDVGFPTKMAQQSYLYLREQISEKEKQIAKQTELLRRMSFEDSLTGLYNRNKFNQMLDKSLDGQITQLGVACFDLNGLKEKNDQMGHSAGDTLICCVADQLQKAFPGKVYRTGGDEFVVIEDRLDKKSFHEVVYAVQKDMEEVQASCSVGVSWRGENCNVKAQYNEADYLMYQEKRRFYGAHPRRRRRETPERAYLRDTDLQQELEESQS
ncbi:MAG: GGDEF domain-containing protein [Lawsonibacter sp.]